MTMRRVIAVSLCGVSLAVTIRLVSTYHIIPQSLLHYKSWLENMTLCEFSRDSLPTLPTCCCCQGNDRYHSAVWSHADVKTARLAQFNHVQTKGRCHVCDGLSGRLHVLGTVTMWSRESETWIYVRMQLYKWPAVTFLYEHAACIVQDIIVVVREDDGWRCTRQSNSAR